MEYVHDNPRILVLTSHKPRHKYFIECLMKSVNVVGVAIEQKSEVLVGSGAHSPTMRQHLSKLSKYESQLMPSSGFQIPNLKILNPGEVNSQDIIAWANEQEPNGIALFGTSILKESWINLFPGKIINLHLGSSPRYRGSATLFWPFFNNEIEHVAATVHIADLNVDSGEILEKVSLNPEMLQNYYQYTTETIKAAIEEFPRIMIDYFAGRKIPTKQDQNLQKYLYRKVDFSESSLLKVLNKYGI